MIINTHYYLFETIEYPFKMFVSFDQGLYARDHYFYFTFKGGSTGYYQTIDSSKTNYVNPSTITVANPWHSIYHETSEKIDGVGFLSKTFEAATFPHAVSGGYAFIQPVCNDRVTSSSSTQYSNYCPNGSYNQIVRVSGNVIFNYAFYRCLLSSVTGSSAALRGYYKIYVESTVVKVGTSAFANNEYLEEVRFLGLNPPELLSNVFSNTPIDNGTGRICVPASAVDTYKAAWPTYASIIQAF